VIDPASGRDETADVLLENGRVKAVGKVSAKADEVIDAAGKIVCPGLIDIHTHLREPGNEAEETIASGSAAAVAGGFTSIACMPNTEPPVDNEAAVEYVARQAARAGLCNVYPIGCVTKAGKGAELAEMGSMVRGGAVAFSDDMRCVPSAGVMRTALLYAKMFDRPIIAHCEDASLSEGGAMNAGTVSALVGLPGMPALAEELIVYRDIALCKAVGGRLHIGHVSTAGAVEIIRRAKAEGVNVTAECCPHHLALTDECCREYDTNFKMNPPLRTAADMAALKRGLADGAVDCLVSDHAPHGIEEKELEFPRAPFGVIGLETSLAVLIQTLIDGKVMDWPQLIGAMTVKPAGVLSLPKGTLAVGADADVTVIDPAREWTVEPDKFRSKSRNTPFAGWKLRGRATTTIVGGVVKYRAD
jgi:dihydroorotase